MVNVPGEDEQQALDFAEKAIKDNNTLNEQQENTLRMLMFAIPYNGDESLLDKTNPINTRITNKNYGLDASYQRALSNMICIATLKRAGVIARTKTMCRALAQIEWDGFAVSLGHFDMDFADYMSSNNADKSTAALYAAYRKSYTNVDVMGNGKYSATIAFSDNAAKLFVYPANNDPKTSNVRSWLFAKKVSSYNRRRRVTIAFVYDKDYTAINLDD
jgi:hypothetical protein